MNNTFKAFCLITALALFTFSELLAQQEDPNRAKANEMFKIAKMQMDSGQFQEANITFRKMLALKTVLPDDISYLFSETLYQIGQYQNSQNLLEKYLNLTGIKGNYYLQSLELKQLLQEKFIVKKDCKLCNAFGYRLAPCDHCHNTGLEVVTCHYCRGKAMVQCLTCNGQGVQIKTDALGERTYSTCNTCSGKGFHQCPVCLGSKEIETDCPVCFGDGLKSTDIICNHQE